jgi:hypothetical protein
MKFNHVALINSPTTRVHQTGALTIFTAIFVLILMTLMLFYATRAGLVEQRSSGNDARQKLAFNAAEAGLDYAVEYILANNLRVLSKKIEAAPDGSGTGTYRPGWFSTGNVRWAPCPAEPADDHPCGGDIRNNPTLVDTDSFYYDDPNTTEVGKYDALPLDANLLGNLPPNTEVRVTAVICPRTLASPDCDADLIPEPGEPPSEPVKFSVFLLSYGYSDCNDDNANGSIDIPDECRGRANVAIPFGSISNFKGSPSVPLVSKNSLPTSGTAEVVPNPNGGGVGVPLSIWANTNSSCPPLAPGGDAEGVSLTVEGSFKTCELEEWYCIDSNGAMNCDSIPANGKCPGNSTSTCECTYPGNEPISFRSGGVTEVGIDVMVDAAFPCDLFEFYFGVPSSQYQTIKSNAKVINDCSVLNTESTGFFWFSGDTCTLDSVGTINNSIVLVSAAETKTVLNGNSEFFGILYISDVEDTGTPAYFKPGGGAVVYGAAIVDVVFPNSGYAGTFKVVYNDSALLGAGGAGSLGGLAGGWRDFGLPDIEWD